MDKKTFGIGVMFLSAIVLFVGNLLVPATSSAQAVLKDRDYQLVTVPSAQGNDTLYIVDGRTGMMAVMTYDAGTRSVIPKVVRPVSDAFPR